MEPIIISLMSYCFMALYLPVNFPSVYVVEKYGLRVGVLIGTALTTLGIWVRCLINVNFNTLLVGQIIIACG